MSYKHERALQIIASLNSNTVDLEYARRVALKALEPEAARVPDFETRVVHTRGLVSDHITFGLLFKTQSDRNEFVRLAREAGRS